MNISDYDIKILNLTQWNLSNYIELEYSNHYNSRKVSKQRYESLAEFDVCPLVVFNHFLIYLHFLTIDTGKEQHTTHNLVYWDIKIELSLLQGYEKWRV